MGTWIEIIAPPPRDLPNYVVPSWARGLKLAVMTYNSTNRMRRALMGTWIEIRNGNRRLTTSSCRALMGTWIEMPMRKLNGKPRKRRALMGTWIEIGRQSASPICSCVVPSWARGLKLTIPLKSLVTTSVVPSWARGLKYDGAWKLWYKVLSCPHGHVD